MVQGHTNDTIDIFYDRLWVALYLFKISYCSRRFVINKNTKIKALEV